MVHKEEIRLILIRILSFFSFLFILLLSSCKNDIAAVHQLIEGDDLAIETGKKMELIYSDSGRMKMRMVAPLMNRFDKPNNYVEFSEGVELYFYDKDEKVNSQLKANYAIKYEDDKKMEAKKDVEVINVKGEKLNTEHLIWDEEKEMIYTEEFVKITTEDEVIYGNGLESNQDFTKYKIKKITGTIDIDEELEEDETE